MLLRRRPVPGPGRERLAAVLPYGAVDGWVPPPGSADGWVPEQPGRAERASALSAREDAGPRGAVPASPGEHPVAGPPAGAARSVEPPHDAARSVEPPHDAAYGGEPAGPAGQALPPRTVLGVLRAARIDPGRRGVLALVAVGVVAALVGGVLLVRGRPVSEPLAVPVAAVAGASAAPTGAPLVVAVAGRVRRPGLVRLPPGSRVDDAVRAAGGPLPGADLGLLNLARHLVDGEQVLVGVPGDAGPAAAATGPGAAGTAGAGVDLNAATAADLDALPGIGPVLAQRIVDWRTEHGRFASVDQLREVSGIGESKYQSLKSKVRV